ncbi:MAG: hypothetical protein MJK13_13405 [Pseudomonadales bacterium]|nr:hypothetical protein [Pseudomonadales bacterium]
MTRFAAILSKELICHCYLDMDKFAAEQQLDFQQYFASELAELELLAADQLLELTENNIHLP